MSEEYPLYPELTEHGEKEAQKIMDSFKPRIKSLVSELMDDLYYNVSMHIESDHWTNYRNQLMEGFAGYNKGEHGDRDFKKLRQSIYSNNKDEIVKDLNQDLVSQVEELKKEIEQMRERESEMCRTHF